MRGFIGLTHPYRINSSLKKEALICSRIGIRGVEAVLAEGNLVEAVKDISLAREIEWLLEQKIAFDPGFSVTFVPEDDEYQTLFTEAKSNQSRLATEALKRLEDAEKSYEQVKKLIDEAKKSNEQVGSNLLSEVDRLLAENNAILDQAEKTYAGVLDVLTRIRCVQLKRLEQADVIPLFYNENLPVQNQNSKKADVIRISLGALPLPDDSTSWEQILEYRSDPDSQSKFLALRHWMSEVARSELTPTEVEEKLEYLIDQYQRHMKLHRMKTNVGTLEIVVTTCAEVFGDLVSFKWGKAAEALFSLKRRQADLIEGELTAPGNEVAYILKARETFS
jgi:uncharacterized protein (DUF1697 family)